MKPRIVHELPIPQIPTNEGPEVASAAHDGLWCICRGEVLLCVDLERAEIRFEVKCELDNRPAPKNAPFLTVTPDQRMWIGQDRIAVLCSDDPFLILRLFETARGDLLCEIPVNERPDGKPWPHTKHGPDFMACAAIEPRADLLAVAVVNFPHIGSKDDPGSAHTWRIDPQTGKVMWATSFEHDPWPGFIGGNQSVSGAGPILAHTDWQTGEVRIDCESGRTWGHAKHLAGLLYTSYRRRGAVGMRIIDGRSGETRSEHEWPQRGVRETSALVGPGALAVNTSSQGLALIGPDGLPAWTTNAPPYPYDIAAYGEGPIFVGTAGSGGHLFAFHRETGDELLKLTSKVYGIPRVQLWTELGLVVPSRCDRRGLRICLRNARHHLLRGRPVTRPEPPRD